MMADLSEPPHVHVGEGRSRRGDDAKIWLAPVAVARDGRYSQSELGRILKIVNERSSAMLKEWESYVGSTGN
ncbi:MAG: DUF4160 domain-containing protein [Caldilineaceae bacterium]|nr:DUF4160 domain-containing protein [Caldilineaceae bacterium]